MQRTLIVSLAMVAGLAACHQAPAPAPIPIAAAVGGYTFDERIPSQGGAPSTTITGEVLILPDTLRVTTQSGPCRAVVATVTGANVPMGFDCPTYGLVFDRQDPVHRSKYSITMTATVNETVCVRYATDAQGRQYCAETGVRPMEHAVTRTGFLHLHPKGS